MLHADVRLAPVHAGANSQQDCYVQNTSEKKEINTEHKTSCALEGEDYVTCEQSKSSKRNYRLTETCRPIIKPLSQQPQLQAFSPQRNSKRVRVLTYKFVTYFQPSSRNKTF